MAPTPRPPSQLTFLPVNLFEQFTRVANLYFLVIAILQFIPGLAPTSWFTTVAPLVIVLTINAIKEIVDDFYRHRYSDNGEGHEPCSAMRAGACRRVPEPKRVQQLP